MRTLKVIAGPGAGRSLQIGVDAVIIGRENADLTIPDPQLSRRHAAVTTSGADVLVQDLGSTNGVFLDGRRISEPARLTPGATMRLGTTEITLELDREEASATASHGAGAQEDGPGGHSRARGPRRQSRRRLLLVLAGLLLPIALAAGVGITVLLGSDGPETRTLDARLTALPLAEPTSAQAAGILEGEPLGRVAVILQRRLEGSPEPGGAPVPLLGTMLVLSRSGSLVLNLRGRLSLGGDGDEVVEAQGLATNGTGDFEGVTGSFRLTGGRTDPRSPYGRFELDGTLEY